MARNTKNTRSAQRAKIARELGISPNGKSLAQLVELQEKQSASPARSSKATNAGPKPVSAFGKWHGATSCTEAHGEVPHARAGFRALKAGGVVVTQLPESDGNPANHQNTANKSASRSPKVTSGAGDPAMVIEPTTPKRDSRGRFVAKATAGDVVKQAEAIIANPAPTGEELDRTREAESNSLDNSQLTALVLAQGEAITGMMDQLGSLTELLAAKLS